MQVLLVACGAAHLPNIARALHGRNALAGLWTSTKNSAALPADKYRRAWLFHLAIKPFYHLAPLGLCERTFHRLSPIWSFWVRRQKPPPFDVVHAIMAYGSEAFDFAEKTGALKVIDASSSHPTSFYGFWQRECDIWAPGTKVNLPRPLFARCTRDLERADLISCPSKFVRDSMLYNGIPESKCVLNPYGVDTSIFTPRSKLPLKPRFICVGMICLRKGHQYLFRAFEKVKQSLPDAELICAGAYHADFSRERRRWEGSFIHYPNLSHPELAKILRESTAFVFPSNEEGFARSIIEAMSSGLPIIATHESGATTLVENGGEGLIVNGRNVGQLADAMLKVATDREMNERMGKAAFARGGKGNSWDDYTDRLLQFYGEALNNRSSLATAHTLLAGTSQ